MAGPTENVPVLPDEVEKGGVFEASSKLQQRASEVRGQRVNWQTYLQSQMISDHDYRFISRLDSAPDSKTRDAVIAEKPLQLAQTFYTLLSQVSKDTTIQYLLTLMDDVLQEDKARVEIFKDYSSGRKESPWVHLLTLLNRPDGFIMNMSARIIAKIASWSRQMMEGSDLQFYLTWLKDQLKTQNEYLPSVARCLQMMLRLDPYRMAFDKIEGIKAIIAVLSSKVNFQIQYQLSFCLWVLAYNSDLAAKLNKFGVIPILADILTDAQKEKVSRIILAVFRNLIEKVVEPQVIKENCISMVQCKVLKQLEFIEQRKFDDEDIQADIEFLKEKMEASLQDLSSYDEYVTEVHSGRLEWSPVHRSERFWRENADRLNEKNYELLKMLIELIKTSSDNLVLSVACYDLGEYVRHYGRGKHVLEQLGGKTLVMSLLTHADPNVRYEALLAVQKLMVHNWEYLGKKVKQDIDDQKKPQGIALKAS